jgi:hypothetical protein
MASLSQEAVLMRLASFFVLAAVVMAPPALRAQSIPDAETAYAQQTLGVRHLVYPLRDGTTVDERGQVRYDGRWDAFQGPDHHPIDEASFFRTVGREDLLTRHQRWSAVKRGLGASRWVLVVGGAMAIVIGSARGLGQPAATGQDSSSQRTLKLTGLALIGGGVVSLLLSHFIDPTPVGADEADRLARDYDQSLRRDVGMTDAASK